MSIHLRWQVLMEKESVNQNLDLLDARIAGRKALSEYENVGQVMVDRDISYADFWDLWMENDCKLTCKESTLYGYEKKTF